MSINSIKPTSNEMHQNTGSLVNADQADIINKASQSVLVNTTKGLYEDSISISCAAMSQIESGKGVQIKSEQHIITNSYEAKNAVKSILSYLYSNSAQVVNSLKSPPSNIVLCIEPEILLGQY